jgi:hypothetical protein
LGFLRSVVASNAIQNLLRVRCSSVHFPDT